MKLHSTRIARLGSIGVTLALAGLALALVVLFLTAAAPAADPVQAAGPDLTDWIIVVGNTGTVNLVNAATDIVYGPVLSGELGSSGGGLFDVDVTPDGKTALISNFGDSAVFFVDISDRISPSLISSVTLPFFAEDIRITKDGQRALVTDGGFSPNIAVLDMISRTLAYTVDMGTRYAQGVDIAPDGTVVVPDYFGGAMHSLFPDASGQLTVTGTYTYTLGPDGTVLEVGYSAGSMGAIPFGASGSSMPATGDSTGLSVGPAAGLPARPVNVAVAPDGQTVILCDVGAYDTPTDTLYSVGIYRITSPGVLTFTGVITGLSRATQSIAFDPTGHQAYLSGNNSKAGAGLLDSLSVLNITAPGVVALGVDGAATFPLSTTYQLFGVDTIAVVNGKAYLGYPTISDAGYDLRIVDLNTYRVTSLPLSGIPVGVAAIPVRRVYLPLLLKPAP